MINEEKCVFFAKEGEKGLNETSASHLCALASQIKAQDEARIASVSFVDVHMSIIGKDVQHKTAAGYDTAKLRSLNDSLDRIARMNSFISWFSEARKTLEDYKKDRLRDDQFWYVENILKETYPEAPELDTSSVRTSSLEDVINDLNIKDRQIYLELEAKSSTLGKAIHPDMAIERARKTAHKIIDAPYSTEGLGDQTIIYKKSVSLDIEDVDNLYIKLQKEYRSTEQSLNKMKAELRKELASRNLKEDSERRKIIQEYSEKREEYQKKLREISLSYSEWRIKEQERLSKIKFAIPDNLKNTYSFLQNIADEAAKQ